MEELKKNNNIMEGKGEWNESEHPRDSDGKFTSKGGQSTMGQEKTKSRKYLQTAKEILDCKLERNNISFANSSTLKSLFENSDFSSKVASMSGDLAASRTQDDVLKSVLNELGYLQKPVLASKEIFKELVDCGAEVIYRGVPIDDYSKELRDDDNPYIGRGIKLNGIWVSHDETTSIQYAKGGSVAKCILNPNAKIAKIDYDFNLEWDNFRFDGVVDGEEMFPPEKCMELCSKGKAGAVSIFFALKGYDAIDAGHNNMVILNRGALIMEDDK